MLSPPLAAATPSGGSNERCEREHSEHFEREGGLQPLPGLSLSARGVQRGPGVRFSKRRGYVAAVTSSGRSSLVRRRCLLACYLLAALWRLAPLSRALPACDY